MTGDTNQKKAEAETVNNTVDSDFEVDDGSDLFETDADTDAEDEDLDDEEGEQDEDTEDEEEASEESEAGEDESVEKKKPAEKKEPAKPDAKKAPETTVKPMLKVTHNGKEVEVDPMSEQGKTYIQKGMNYDHLSEQLAEMNRVLEEYGRINGVSKQDALKTLAQAVNAATVEQVKKDLKAKYPGAPDELITELASKQAAEKALSVKEAKSATEAQKAWEDLTKEYPTFSKLEDLPKDARDAIAAGKTPLLAMKDHEIAELKKASTAAQAALEAEKQNKKNRDSSLGSAKGTGGKKSADEFVTGLGM